MPAAAVIPAPVAYIKVVAVKKLVVGFLQELDDLSFTEVSWNCHDFCILSQTALVLTDWGPGTDTFTLRKIECSKQAYALNKLAWNNKIGLWFYFVVF